MAGWTPVPEGWTPVAANQQNQATPSAPVDLDSQLHQAYDNRPLWRKLLGLQPENLSPELQQHYDQSIQQAKQSAGQQLKDTFSSYGQGAVEGLKMAPFLALGPAGSAVAKALGGGAAGLAANAAVQGLGSAGIAKLEGASNTGAAVAGGLGAAGPAVESVLPTAAGLAGKARQLYQSALKPRPSLGLGGEQMVQTGLANAIPVSKGGIEKLNSLVEDLNDKVQAVVDSDPTRAIDPTSVATRIGQLRPTFANQVNPEADLASLARSKAEFLAKHSEQRPYTSIDFRPIDGGDVGAVPTGNAVATVPKNMTAGEAQAEKIGTYRQLSKKYGELQSSQVESEKALARGLKEELAVQFPELTALNQREGSLLNLEPELERAVARISNHQMFGIGTPIAAGAAKAVTGSNAAAAGVGVFKAIMDDPRVKSKLAIELVRSGVPMAQAAQRINYFSGALARSAAVASTQNPSGQTDSPQQ